LALRWLAVSANAGVGTALPKLRSGWPSGPPPTRNSPSGPWGPGSGTAYRYPETLEPELDSGAGLNVPAWSLNEGA